MPEMKFGFSYSAGEPFTKNRERMQNSKKQDIHDIFIKTSKINLVWLDFLRF